MDPETLELVQLSHAAFAEHTADHYSTIRSQLDNRLGGIALEAVNQAEDAVVNRKFINSLVGALPRANTGRTDRFNLQSQADVRWTMNSVLWIEGAPGNQTLPYYIIGQVNKGSKVNLLLHQALTDDHHITGTNTSLITAEMRKKSYVKMRDKTKVNLYKPLDLDEVNKLKTSNDSFNVQWTYPPDNLMAAEVADSTIVLGQMIRYITGIPRIKITSDLSQAIENHTLARFNTIDFLNHLSSAFNKNDEFQAIIQKHIALQKIKSDHSE